MLKIIQPYRGVNTHCLSFKNQSVNAVCGNNCVCSDIHTKHTNTLYGQNVGCVNVKLGFSGLSVYMTKYKLERADY